MSTALAAASSPEATPVGAADIPFPGGFARFVTANDITRQRVETFLAREQDTLAWIETFQADDLFADIGANVGMCSIWAALTRGVRVYAFEPESQNYGLFNMNLYLNGLSEQVSAYCMAISDVAGFDSLYLSRFEPGGSGNAFGQKLDHDLQPMQPSFRQGCFAAPFDELVEAGVAPAPTHIKIGIDGLEHAVIVGMNGVLSRPELKSVLVEINGNLDEHTAIIEHMTERGFHFDDRQRAVSMQAEGKAPGVGNVIFWKDPEAAARLGAVLSGEVVAPNIVMNSKPKAGGFTAEEAIDFAIAAIEATPVQTEPTPYWHCTEIFPPSFYEEMLARLPAPSLYTPITELERMAGDDPTAALRGAIPFSGAALSTMPDDLAAFWSDIATNMRSERFALAMLRKFLPQIAERFGADVGNMTFSAQSTLLADDAGFAMGPHTDMAERVLTACIYLPDNARQPERGISLYLPKEPEFACEGGLRHPFEDFNRIKTLDYMPNSAFCVFKTPTSFQGVEAVDVAEANPVRRLITYTLDV